MHNPFDSSHSKLFNISSGVVATPESSSDMKSMKGVGEKGLQDFIARRLMERSEQFFVPLKANKLRTFSTPMKTKSKSGSEISLRNDRKFMARMLIAQNKGMSTILSHSLSPVYMPLSSDDASLSKTNKADLLHALESTVPDCLVEKLPEGALIIDFMGLIHSMKNVYDTESCAHAILDLTAGASLSL